MTDHQNAIIKFIEGAGQAGKVGGWLVPEAERCMTWKEYREWMRGNASIIRPVSQKHTCGWTIPIIRKQGAKGHALDAVEKCSAFISLDLDEGYWTEASVADVLNGLEFFAYSTTKGTPTKPRWRFVVLLDRDHSKDENLSVWFYLNSLFNNELDQQTKNCNRISYIAQRWIGMGKLAEENEWFERTGKPLSVDDCVKTCPVDPSKSSEAIEIIGTKPRPIDFEVITEKMRSKYFSEIPGSGRFYKLLLRAAGRCHFEQYQITHQELASLCMAVSTDKPRDRKNAEHSAKNAMGYVSDGITREQWTANRQQPCTDDGIYKPKSAFGQRNFNNSTYYGN